MRDIATRTTEAQMTKLRELLDDRSVTVHSVRHNLDGQWLNVEYTDDCGDWICSIALDGTHEETQ